MANFDVGALRNSRPSKGIAKNNAGQSGSMTRRLQDWLDGAAGLDPDRSIRSNRSGHHTALPEARHALKGESDGTKANPSRGRAHKRKRHKSKSQPQTGLWSDTLSSNSNNVIVASSQARNLGALAGDATITDSLVRDGSFDDYQFQLNTPSTYQFVLSGVSANTSLQLLDSSGHALKTAEGTTTQSGVIDGALTTGTYYIRVASAAADTDYTLSTTSRSVRESARSAYSLIDSMGVATHLRYYDTSYGNFEGIVKPRLQELGIRHIRDGGGDSEFFRRVSELAKVGIKSTLVIDPRDGYTPENTVGTIKPVLSAVEAVEGPNEWDGDSSLTYQGQAFPNGVAQFQNQLYQAIKSDPATAALPVIAPSLSMPYNSASLGSLSSVVDMGNMHSYAGGNQPATDLDWKWIPQAQAVSGANKPIVATETGWHNATSDPQSSQPGVSETVAGKYIPRTYLEYFNRGIKRTFMYELMDQRVAGDQENNFGLLRADGSPKPAFNATRNLISLLNDSVEPSTLGTLDYYLTGDTQNVHHTLLQKSNGDFYLVMWLEKPSTDVDLSQNVTLNLMSSIHQAVTYLPNQSTTPTAQYNTPTQLTLNVPDHPLVVQLDPTN